MRRVEEYKTEDISVVIPTYKRAEDVKETLKHLVKVIGKLCEVIIVDQSPDNETRNLLRALKNKKIKYVFSKIPSTAIARNVGVKSANKKSKIICFIDDDVTIEKDYFGEVVRIFNADSETKAAAIYVPTSEEPIKGMDLLLKRIFLLGRREGVRTEFVSAYGNLYPEKLNKMINSQWLPGVNTAYLKTVFEEQIFDENLLGYSIAEDIDFSYRLWKRYPHGIIISPNAKLVHRASLVERHPTEKMSYGNQIDHLYFQFKNMNSFIGNAKYLWAITGIFILRLSKMVATRKKTDSLKFMFFLKSLFYCLTHIDLIKQGKVREFLKAKRFNN